MGACYTVYADFVIDDEEKFIDTFRDAMGDMNARWEHELGDDATVEEALELLIPRGRYDKDGKIYSVDSDFDASYGWERVMEEMFEALAPVLANGSYLEVYPDEQVWHMDVVDGEIA